MPILAALLLILTQDAPDVVVTARRGAPPPAEPVAYFARLCWEANRLTGRSAAPVDEPDWRELEPEERASVRLDDPHGRVFALADETRGHTLFLKIETLARPAPWRLEESRCTLTVVGGTGHDGYHGRLSRLFGGPGTQRHVGESDGVARLPGWRQTAWAGAAPRGVRAWRAGEAIRGKLGGSWLVVTSPSWYRFYDYLLGDLKTGTNRGRPVSVMSFALMRGVAR